MDRDNPPMREVGVANPPNCLANYAWLLRQLAAAEAEVLGAKNRVSSAKQDVARIFEANGWPKAVVVLGDTIVWNGHMNSPDFAVDNPVDCHTLKAPE